jgi:hypothetical protein
LVRELTLWSSNRRLRFCPQSSASASVYYNRLKKNTMLARRSTQLMTKTSVASSARLFSSQITKEELEAGLEKVEKFRKYQQMQATGKFN